MKLSFSTIACPEWSFDEVFATAKDLGFDGIELRTLEREKYAPRMEPFLGDPEAFRARMASSGLGVSLLSSRAALGSKSEAERAVHEVNEYLKTAAHFGVPYVSVMTARPRGDEAYDGQLASLQYARMCETAETLGVELLVESSGTLADTKKLAELVDASASKAAGALWDPDNTQKLAGEAPEQSIHTLSKRIKYVHLKDSAATENGVEYRPVGSGTSRIAQTVSGLAAEGYKGTLSLVWLPQWNADGAGPGIIIAKYADYMKRLLEKP